MINLIKAFILMFKTHRRQRDRGGTPYIYHPITVSRKVKGYDEKIVALLHDVFEDSDIKLEDVEFLSEDQRAALKLLTRNPSEGYQNYIENIKENPIARDVKKADIQHNMDISRIKNPTVEDFGRRKKYLMYYKTLSK